MSTSFSPFYSVLHPRGKYLAVRSDQCAPRFACVAEGFVWGEGSVLVGGPTQDQQGILPSMAQTEACGWVGGNDHSPIGR